MNIVIISRQKANSGHRLLQWNTTTLCLWAPAPYDVLRPSPDRRPNWQWTVYQGILQLVAASQEPGKVIIHKKKCDLIKSFRNNATICYKLLEKLAKQQRVRQMRFLRIFPNSFHHSKTNCYVQQYIIAVNRKQAIAE